MLSCVGQAAWPRRLRKAGLVGDVAGYERLFALLGFTFVRPPIKSMQAALFRQVLCSWRGGREAEGGGLLNRYTLSRRIVGSNPISSATDFFKLKIICVLAIFRS